MANKEFVNPYNFFPLQSEAPIRGEVEKGSYTGVINYSLVTRTPLIIPNTSNDHAFAVKDNEGKSAVKDHKSYDFFSYDDFSDTSNKDLFNADGTREGKYSEPVIPGSEIRGMLRSYYEILTNSCMSFVDDDEVLSKRTNEVFKPGLLEKKLDGTYILHEAEDCLLRMRNEEDLSIYTADDTPNLRIKSYANAQLREGQKVYVDIVERGYRIKPVVDGLSLKDDGRSEVGYVIKGEPGPIMSPISKEKHNCHVFIENKKIRALTPDEVSTLSTVLKIYKDNAASGYTEYRKAWSAFQDSEGRDMFPVYYSRINNSANIMLSPASITREIYTVKLRELLRDHYSCCKQDKLCPACALFGMLGKNFHVTSRIRVADLRLSDGDSARFSDDAKSLFIDKVTLEPLNSPKINNMEFYIKRPAENAWFWTYDYYVDESGHVVPCKPEINGRKFYWHQPDMEVKNAEPDNLNASMRPLKENVGFTGKIYFDHLTDIELNELIYTINAGDNDKPEVKNHCYKLGHGKPLGYGSVALHVEDVVLRKVSLDDDNETMRCRMDAYDGEDPEISLLTVERFRKMTDFGLLKGKSIHYPKPDRPDDEGNYPIFKWFVDNHGGYDHSKGKTARMPSSRLQMTYRRHMYALEPELRGTGAPKADGKSFGTAPKNHGIKKSNNNPIVTVTITGISSKGSIFFFDNGKKGTITQKSLGGKSFRVGDKVKVKFSNEKIFDDGNKVRFYELA